MLHKIENNEKFGNSHIKILYPGNSLEINDTGLGSIGRIDQANIEHKTTIKMHPHSNDEILSYFRRGNVIHRDSAGITKQINAKTLMLMKAGTVFYHEEEILDQLEGLQIFIRPKTKDAIPKVEFAELEEEFSHNKWRLLASPNNESYLEFTSQTWVYDAYLEKNRKIILPESNKNTSKLVYVFQGEIKINDLFLIKGESVIVKNEKIEITTHDFAELVFFETNEESDYYVNGMFSGNQKNK